MQRNLAAAGYSAVGALVCLLLFTGCDDTKTSPALTGFQTVSKVTKCAAGDQPEVALQGQVPAAVRANGFQGFNCNLKLLGQWRGEGGTWSSAMFKDRAGHRCFYFATAYTRDFLGNEIKREHPGVPVIDITNSYNPVVTGWLTTPAMLNPWESLRVNPRRQVLAADFGEGGANGGPELDLYDLSGDCRKPQLIASARLGSGGEGEIPLPATPVGHEGSFAPDGLTYYVGDTKNNYYYAVDVTNMTKPKVIAKLDMKTGPLGGGPHGLSISADGTRGYFVTTGSQREPLADDQKSKNGFYVVDTSEVQARKPDAQMRIIAAVEVRDGTAAQHTIPIKVAGKPYIVHVDEGGAVFFASPKIACDAKLPPFPMARIFDASDETQPKLASKLMLETHDPANCDRVLPDIVGLGLFTYGSHYCSVDNRDNATVLACAYFNSGIRVFDIRDPGKPKEIAYFNPPGEQIAPLLRTASSWKPGSPGLCASRIDFDFERKELITMCQHTGVLVMQFENNVWPMPQSTPAVEQNN